MKEIKLEEKVKTYSRLGRFSETEGDLAIFCQRKLKLDEKLWADAYPDSVSRRAHRDTRHPPFFKIWNFEIVTLLISMKQREKYISNLRKTAAILKFFLNYPLTQW